MGRHVELPLPYLRDEFTILAVPTPALMARAVHSLPGALPTCFGDGPSCGGDPLRSPAGAPTYRGPLQRFPAQIVATAVCWAGHRANCAARKGQEQQSLAPSELPVRPAFRFVLSGASPPIPNRGPSRDLPTRLCGPFVLSLWQDRWKSCVPPGSCGSGSVESPQQKSLLGRL
jgi:hypothetical protein